MEKIWYIFDNKFHKGPYTKSEVLELLDRGTISIKVLVWREGIKEWVVLRECSELISPDNNKNENSSTPPSVNNSSVVLPELPKDSSMTGGTKILIRRPKDSTGFGLKTVKLALDESELDKQSEMKAKGIKLIPDRLSPLSLKNVFKKREKTGSSTSQTVKESSREDVQEVIPLFIEKPSKRKNFVFIVLLGVILLGTGALLLLGGKKTNPQMYRDLTHLDFVRLNNIADEDVIGAAGFALPIKGSAIWLALANVDEAHLEIRLSSIKGKILASESIVAIGKTKMVSGIANFKKINLIEGNKIVSGHYKIEVQGRVEGSKSRFVYLLERFGLIDGGSPVAKKSSALILDEEFLLARRPKSFQKKLDKFNSSTISRKSRPINSMLEKYRTFYFLLERLEQLFIDAVNSIKTGQQIDRFKLSYATEIAPVLQNVIQDNDIRQRELQSIYPYAAMEYQRLVDYGKKITALVGDSYASVKKVKLLNDKNRVKFINNMETKVEQLRQIGNGKIKQLTNKLEDLAN